MLRAYCKNSSLVSILFPGPLFASHGVVVLTSHVMVFSISPRQVCLLRAFFSPLPFSGAVYRRPGTIEKVFLKPSPVGHVFLWRFLQTTSPTENIEFLDFFLTT